MKAFKNYNEVKAQTEKVKIPAGGYEAVIMNAEEKHYDGYSKLEIAVDITAGDYKNYFADDYRSQQGEDKKWKGVLRLSVPTDDGSDRDEWYKSVFKANMNAVEDSNPGYHWGWDEKSLKGKKIGLLLRNEEYDFNGFHGWKAKPFKLIDLSAIKEGKFTIPKDKPLNSDSGTNSSSASVKNADFDEIILDDDLPF